jgi:hypothetical protein
LLAFLLNLDDLEETFVGAIDACRFRYIVVFYETITPDKNILNLVEETKRVKYFIIVIVIDEDSIHLYRNIL